MDLLKRTRVMIRRLFQQTSIEDVEGAGEEKIAREKLHRAVEHVAAVTANTREYARCVEETVQYGQDQNDRFSRSINDLVADIRGVLDNDRN